MKRDKFLDWYIAEVRKYGASYTKPRPTIVYKCPTCGLKHHSTTKPDWVK